MQSRPTAGPGSQWPHFREVSLVLQSKVGKGTAVQRCMGGGGVRGVEVPGEVLGVEVVQVVALVTVVSQWW